MVRDDQRWVAAIEGDDQPRFGQERDIVWGRRVRFHEAHYRESTAGKLYKTDNAINR